MEAGHSHHNNAAVPLLVLLDQAYYHESFDFFYCPGCDPRTRLPVSCIEDPWGCFLIFVSKKHDITFAFPSLFEILTLTAHSIFKL
jgi:hypothetical protein